MDFFKKLIDTPDYTAEFPEDERKDRKVISIFAYIGILFLIPLIWGKGSKYARFNANQGLVLFLFSLAGSVVFTILKICPFLSPVVNVISYLFSIVCTLLMVFGIVCVAKGKAKELPIIGKIKLLK